MKRTWIVTVAMSVGHELHDAMSETDIYGPFTREEAERLAGALNPILDDGESEHLEAVASPLDTQSSASIIRSYRQASELQSKEG